MLLQRVRHARDGPPGACAAHERVQLPGRLAQDLGSGCQMRPEVGQVLELVREECCARRLLRGRLSDKMGPDLGLHSCIKRMQVTRTSQEHIPKVL